jgi:choice-of-anchor B domain-containing protein
MRRFREYLSLSFLVALGVVPAGGQTVRSDLAPSTPLAGFGTAIAIGDGEVFMSRTGASLLLPLLPSRAGGVHVFRPGGETGEWEETAHLTGSDAGLGIGFGNAMAVDGNILLVGAPGQYDGRGAVYLFQRDGAGEWREAGVLSAGDGVPGDSLGGAIALHGDVALVGASRHADGAGAVYTFRGDAWTQQTKLTPADVRTGDRFGVAVAFDGARALIGAVGRDSLTGGAHVFGYDGGAWNEEAVIRTADVGPRSAFGARLALSGDHAIIAAPQANRSAGAAFVFARDGAGRWTQQGRLVPADSSPGSFFGFNVVATENEAWIGAPGTSGLTGTTYRFRRDGSGSWAAAAPLTPADLPAQAFFGGAAAVRDDVAVVAALGTAFGAGTGYVYQRDASGVWRERGEIVDESSGYSAIAGGQVNCTDGRAADVFDCADVDVVSFLPASEVGAGRGIAVSDAWGWTDPQSGNEYAIVGRFDATAFIDVSDPYNPKYLGELPLTEGATPNLWRDMKVYEDHAFIVSDGAGPHGIQIFDLTQLRDVADAPVTFEETAHYDGIHSAHNIVINEETGFAYTVGNSMGGETCGGAFHMVNIQDPTHPTFAGCFADPSTGRTGTGYNHDAQCVTYQGPDTDHVGKEICFGSAETALSIADVTDKQNPVALAAASYPNVGYAHQGWITDDHKYFYMNDELDEIAGTTPSTRTLIWDVTDLDDPILAKEHMGTTGASDHNLYVRGNLMYQSNYVAGLRIFDISDPENPEEVAYFDTVPFGENVPGFAGSWSNYPYFESGIIVVTSMREGVFILKKRDTRLVF